MIFFFPVLMKLEKMVEPVFPLHKRVLRPKHKVIKLQYQLSLNGFYPSESRRAILMGDFFENLSWAIYGGELNDRKYDISFANGIHVEETIKPDIVDHKEKIMTEVKSNCTGHSCNITTRQINCYRSLQYELPDYKFVLQVYRHTIPEIKAKKRTEEEVIRELLNQPVFSLELPLSVLLRIRELSNEPNAFARNYVGNGARYWPSSLCINSQTTNALFIRPNAILELLGFNLERFEIRRHLSPSNIRMNGYRLKQFPVARVIDRDHERWVEEFRGYYEEEMERPDVRTEDSEIVESPETIEAPF